MIHILAVSGSLKAASSNTRLIHAINHLLPPEVTLTVFNGIADLPHFSPDLDLDDPPMPVTIWREALRAADAILISTPEYAYGMPGSLKNALDWVVSSGELLNKPVAAISAAPNSGGGERARQGLILTLTALSADIIEEAGIAIPAIGTKLDTDGRINDPALIERLHTAIEAVIRSVHPVDARQSG